MMLGLCPLLGQISEVTFLFTFINHVFPREEQSFISAGYSKPNGFLLEAVNRDYWKVIPLAAVFVKLCQISNWFISLFACIMCILSSVVTWGTTPV